MQEEVDQKTIALSMKTGKFTAQVLQAALKKYLQHRAKGKTMLHHGQQNLRLQSDRICGIITNMRCKGAATNTAALFCTFAGSGGNIVRLNRLGPGAQPQNNQGRGRMAAPIKRGKEL